MYHPRGFLTDLANVGPTGSTLSEFGSTTPSNAMTYDADGNLLTLQANVPGATSLSGSTSYGYDNLDELTSESSTRNGGYSNTFHYDAGQNPTTFRNATIPTANVDNQIPRTGTTYDGEGNPATYNSTALTFDPEDRMVSYGSAETNGYGPDGQRAWTTTSSGTTFFLYDGDTPLCELNSSGAVTATNTFGADGLISRNTSANGSTFYAFDVQGSTSQRLNSSGTVQTNAITDAFGAVAGAVATDPYSGYNSEWGYYNDPGTGLQLLGHRFYDQATGRFINRDPIGYDGGIDVYEYCGNGPVGWGDPSGLFLRNPGATIDPGVSGPIDGGIGDISPAVEGGAIGIAGPFISIGIGVYIFFTPTPAGPGGPELPPIPGGPGYHNGKKSKLSPKEKKNDTPGWTKLVPGNPEPRTGNPKDCEAWVKKIFDLKYGAGNYSTGPGSEYSQALKGCKAANKQLCN